MDKNDKHHNKKSENKKHEQEKKNIPAANTTVLNADNGATLKHGGKVKKTY